MFAVAHSTQMQARKDFPYIIDHPTSNSVNLSKMKCVQISKKGSPSATGSSRSSKAYFYYHSNLHSSFLKYLFYFYNTSLKNNVKSNLQSLDYVLSVKLQLCAACDKNDLLSSLTCPWLYETVCCYFRAVIFFKIDFFLNLTPPVPPPLTREYVFLNLVSPKSDFDRKLKFAKSIVEANLRQYDKLRQT